MALTIFNNALDVKSVTPVDEELAELLASLSRKLHRTDDIAWDTEPVPIEQWINDPYYCGPLATQLWPKVKESIIEACQTKYSEIIYSGSIGYGKTTCAATIHAYQVYELSCMNDPASALGVMEGSPLYICFVSISKERAKETGYNKFVQIIRGSQYFREKFPPNPKFTGMLVFPKNIIVRPSITSEHGILSYDLVGMTMDEVSFMRITGKSKLVRTMDQVYDQGLQIYNQAKLRMKSRFYRGGKGVRAKLILASSALYPDDLIERRRMEVMRDKEEDVFICTMSLWDAKPKGTYSSKTFRVEVGDDTRLSRILNDDESPREGALVITPPIDFKQDFERDIEKAIRDIAGVPLMGISPLITDRPKVFKAIRRTKEEDPSSPYHDFECQHPYSVEKTFLLDGHTLLKDMIAVKDSNGVWRPRVNPNAPRFIHVDTALTQDAMGFAMAHPMAEVTIKKRLPDGTETLDVGVKTYVDFMLQIVRPPQSGSEIPWSRLEDLIDELAELGFQICLITMETYQSRPFMQKLNDKGYNAEKLSVDQTPEPYMNLRTCINEGLVSFYNYDIFLQELLRLEFNPIRKKVDHPRRNGSKDVSDAVCGAVYSCTTRYGEFDTSQSTVHAQIF
jgi:hypothetical protein